MTETFEREGFYSFAIYEPKTGNELNMLQANEMADILPHELRYFNGIPKLYYHVEGRQPVQLVYEKTKLNHEAIILLMDGVCRAIDTVRNYLLDFDDLLLDEEHIYYSWEKNTMEFLYLPGFQRPVMEQLTGLLEYMLKNVNYQDVTGANLIYQMYEDVQKQGISLELLRAYCSGEICQPPIFGPRYHETENNEMQPDAVNDKKEEGHYDADLYVKENVLKQLLRKLKDGWRNRNIQRGLQAGQPSEEKKSTMAISRKAYSLPEREPGAFHVGEAQDNATTLLKSQSEELHLKAVGGDFPMLMPGEKVIIGRQEGACDYVIDRREVSRIHASLMWNKGEAMVTDLNSSNGTYINENRLGVHESMTIKRGDEVRFGSVTFVVV